MKVTVLQPPKTSTTSASQAATPTHVGDSVSEASSNEHLLRPFFIGRAAVKPSWQRKSDGYSQEIDISIPESVSISKPMLAVAFDVLDADKNAKNDHLVNVSTCSKKTDKLVHFDINGTSNVHGARASWLAIPHDHPLISTGRWDTGIVRLTEGQTSVSSRIKFPNAFLSQPKIVLGLSGLNISGQWRAHAEASDIDTHGFLLTLHTMRGTHLHGAAVTWIAFRADVHNACSGSFTNTRGSRGVVDFGKTFRAPPQVFIAFTKLDANHYFNLRARAEVVDVTATGMEWEITSWADTVLHECTASYLAIEGETVV